MYKLTNHDRAEVERVFGPIRRETLPTVLEKNKLWLKNDQHRLASAKAAVKLAEQAVVMREAAIELMEKKLDAKP